VKAEKGSGRGEGEWLQGEQGWGGKIREGEEGYTEGMSVTPKVMAIFTQTQKGGAIPNPDDMISDFYLDRRHWYYKNRISVRK